MDLKDFLDYLCGAGFANRVEVAVRVEGKNYPRCVPNNSIFFDTGYEYTICIPKALQDATRRSNNYTEKNRTINPSFERRVASSVYGFLTAIDRCLEGGGAIQKGGTKFTSRFVDGSNTTKNRAEYVDSRTVNVDDMMFAMGAFGDRFHRSGSLDMAWALYYMKEMMALLDEQAMSLAPKEQEVKTNKRNPQKRKKTASEEPINKPINEPQSEPNSQPLDRRNEEFEFDKYDLYKDNPIIKDSVLYDIAKDTTRKVDGSPLHQPGDTIARRRFRIRLNGAREWELPEHYPLPDSIK